ncbi:MAG TPA: hypothetical protein VES67_19080 [Vicinamibacterales bacterium]|nr:hypothetical protein [Vicinamibacterales bacterium]
MRAKIFVVALLSGLAGFSSFSGAAKEQEQVPVGVPATPAVQEPPAIQKRLQLSFDGKGNVTLIAQGVTLQEILSEWTRIGGCYFPNAEKLSRAVILPLQFENMPELKVLDSLLRSAAGIVVAPRTTRTVGASSFEVVQILATSTATASGAYAPINTMPAPLMTPGSPDDEIPPVTPVNQPQRGADPSANRPPPPPTVGVPSSGVFVPIQPVPSGPGPGRGGTTPPPATPPGSSGAGS